MTDGHGRWLVYNGEIYNFRDLRAELATGRTFRSRAEQNEGLATASLGEQDTIELAEHGPVF